MEIIAIALIVGLLLGRTLRSCKKQGRAVAAPEEPIPVTEAGPEEKISGMAVESEEKAAAAPEEPIPVTGAGPEEKRENLRSEILKIIRSAKEGITLPQLGEKMHRHFAPLIGPVRLLLEEGVIKREDRVYKIVEQ